jgi:hypothetical protein
VLPFFRWQWFWRSRQRLLLCGLGVTAVGLVCLAFTVVTWPDAMRRASFARLVAMGTLFLAVGGYPVLVALLSPAGAFGDHDHDDSRDHRRRAWRRKRAAAPDDEPIPLAPDKAEGPTARTTRCPTCHEPLTVPPDRVTECPKCHERFTPD